MNIFATFLAAASCGAEIGPVETLLFVSSALNDPKADVRSLVANWTYCCHACQFLSVPIHPRGLKT